MRSLVLRLVVVSVALLTLSLVSRESTAQAQVPSPGGNSSAVPTSGGEATPIETVSLTSPRLSLASLYSSTLLRWGTSVTRPVYRSPLFVLRERLGLMR